MHVLFCHSLFPAQFMPLHSFIGDRLPHYSRQSVTILSGFGWHKVIRLCRFGTLGTASVASGQSRSPGKWSCSEATAFPSEPTIRLNERHRDGPTAYPDNSDASHVSQMRKTASLRPPRQPPLRPSAARCAQSVSTLYSAVAVFVASVRLSPRSNASNAPPGSELSPRTRTRRVGHLWGTAITQPNEIGEPQPLQ